MNKRDASESDAGRLMRVLNVTRRLAATVELAELLNLIIETGRQVLEADRGSVFLYQKETEELYSVAATGEEEIRFSSDRGIAGASAQARRVVNVPDCYASPLFNREIDRATGYRTHTLIAVPLVGYDDELVGVLQLLNSAKGQFDAEDERIAEVLGSQAAVAIQRTKLLAERLVKLRMEQDLALARELQMKVLPRTVPACPGYDIAARAVPAEETGGDIYDLVPVRRPATRGSDGGGEAAQDMLLLLADASGHGLGPALTVTQARAMLRMGLRMSSDLDVLHHHINQQLCEDFAHHGFVTAFLGMLDPQAHRLAYHAAGQGPLLVYRAAEDRCEFFNASTIPWGVLDDPPEHAQGLIALAPGDVVALLTDGFYEAVNEANDPVGRERIGDVLRARRAEPAAAILAAMFELVDSFTAGQVQADDLTGIVVRRVAG